MIYKIDFLCNVLAIFITIGFITILINFIHYKFIIGETEVLKILKNNKFLKFSVILFLSSILLIIILNNYSDRLMRNEVISKLNEMKSGKTELFINNEPLKSHLLISQLRGMNEHTTKISGNFELIILLKNSTKSIELLLRRNPQNKEIYWIFYPKYESSTNYCVGEIETDKLNDFKKTSTQQLLQRIWAFGLMESWFGVLKFSF